ncbi:MAG: putative enoyl-CoA hydratase echA12 [Acidimicrobiales bacterium]|nr:MAG: enoyl-CoA hydratase [Actinomycetota bacterium]MBV6509443.1 putative enoyl-CoA hydratase echA12 [Acidimicrobiales bacterium]RIK06759.1 MAG: enoyl-CoA hydratase [Acidobacteriota bacterium]
MAEALYEEIRYVVEDPVATITLDRPDALNAWTNRMGAELKHAIARAEVDEAVVGIVITGAGRGFCAGADMNVLSGLARGEGEVAVPSELEADPGNADWGEDLRGTYTYLMSVPKPVIAAVNGAVAGMAVPIVAACDLRFASERAVFTTSFAQRGLVAEWGSSWLLPRLVGTANALDILFSARKFDADEAARMGLVNRVVPHEELISFTHGYVESLARNCSPTSLAIMKRQVYQQLAAPLGPSEKESVQLMIESFGRPDFAEGVQSYLQKRPPDFRRL